MQQLTKTVLKDLFGKVFFEAGKNIKGQNKKEISLRNTIFSISGEIQDEETIKLKNVHDTSSKTKNSDDEMLHLTVHSRKDAFDYVLKFSICTLKNYKKQVKNKPGKVSPDALLTIKAYETVIHGLRLMLDTAINLIEMEHQSNININRFVDAVLNNPNTSRTPVRLK